MVTAEQVSQEKNVFIDALKAKMGVCPYYGTQEILDEVMLQKKAWGGKEIPENKVLLSASANVAFSHFAEQEGVLKNQPFPYYQSLYERFLQSPKPELSEKDKQIRVLKLLVTMRNAFLSERLAMEARIRNRAKDLDMLHPVEESYRVKMLEKFRAENEPLLDELKDGFSWQNLISYGTAQMGYTQKTIIEKEIGDIVSQMPIWKNFGDFIPGFGLWTCAFFIAKIQDPRRFPDTGKLKGFSGIAPKNGEPMRRKRGEKANYDPEMKEMLCKIFPESFMKVAGRFPDEPYAKFLLECRVHQNKKAVETTPDALATKYKVPVSNITNLGFEERDGKKYFLGFKVKKQDGEEFTTLNPGHCLQRALRQFAATFISDFYHMWLFLSGENPRIEGNPRIMAVLQKRGLPR